MNNTAKIAIGIMCFIMLMGWAIVGAVIYKDKHKPKPVNSCSETSYERKVADFLSVVKMCEDLGGNLYLNDWIVLAHDDSKAECRIDKNINLE